MGRKIVFESNDEAVKHVLDHFDNVVLSKGLTKENAHEWNLEISSKGNTITLDLNRKEIKAS